MNDKYVFYSIDNKPLLDDTTFKLILSNGNLFEQTFSTNNDLIHSILGDEGSTINLNRDTTKNDIKLKFNDTSLVDSLLGNNSSVEIKNNDFSKRLFAFNSKNILLSINPTEEKEENNFKISELLQGKINANIINKQIYSQANHHDAYKNYIVTKDIFIKSNPILDVIKYMEGTYKTDIETPSLFSYKTNNKINNINNNAYIEGICCYYLNS